VAVKPGDTLRDKFRIDALIGRGGMGQVFAATDLHSRTQVAVKVVSRMLVDDILMVRLHREAEAAQRIRSDFVPRVLEVSDTDDGETFLVMERLVGESLSQRIRDNGALPWSEVRRIGEDILRGLIDAHTAGIVHRDLKPSNVFLALKDASVRAMVLDFGVCKMDGVDAERLTGTGESIGTVAYMAPEQIRGAARVDERADLYAFGVLVFELLCGRLPHDGPSQMAILASKLENAPARLRDCARVAVPDGTDDVVMRALHRDPAMRFASAQALLKAWRALSKGEHTSATEELRPAQEGAAPTSIMEPATEVSRPPPALLALASEPSAAEALLAPTFVPPSSNRRGSVPPEPHPTQTSLTTHHTSIHRKSGGARVAVVLAACALVAGIVAASISFTRGPVRSEEARVPALPEPASLAAAPPESASAVSEAPVAAFDVPSLAPTNTATFELPPDPTPSAPGVKPRSRHRARPHAAPRSSAPRITSQPRY
jgi:eukaryotic-like serine/threonine-protein kinase